MNILQKGSCPYAPLDEVLRYAVCVLLTVNVHSDFYSCIVKALIKGRKKQIHLINVEFQSCLLSKSSPFMTEPCFNILNLLVDKRPTYPGLTRSSSRIESGVLFNS